MNSCSTLNSLLGLNSIILEEPPVLGSYPIFSSAILVCLMILLK